DSKYGRFPLKKRRNVDRVPPPFANGLVSTWADKGSRRVRVLQPSAGLEKRQCTLQRCFGPAEELVRPCVIFRRTGKRITAVEKAAWHPEVDVEWQACAWADSSFCNSWAKNTYRKAVCGTSLTPPKEESILFADNLHGQTTEEFRRILKQDCNTLLWLVPPRCTDEVQPVDAGYGRLFEVYVRKELDVFLPEGDNVERWESNKLTASDRRILLTQWIGRAAKKLDSDMRYRRRLFEKTGLAMTADGSDDDLINLEGV
ncbi:unnamed protein product, partial [Pylaiella littoralis]